MNTCACIEHYIQSHLTEGCYKNADEGPVVSKSHECDSNVSGVPDARWNMAKGSQPVHIGTTARHCQTYDI